MLHLLQPIAQTFQENQISSAIELLNILQDQQTEDIYWAYAEHLKGLLLLQQGISKKIDGKHALSQAENIIESIHPMWYPTLNLLSDSRWHDNTNLTPYNAALAAGGKSRRFGTDKALFVWKERSLLEHAACGLHGAPLRFLIAPVGKYTLPNWETQTEHPMGEGPLNALAMALQIAPYGWLAFAGIDQPLLNQDYWTELWSVKTQNQLQNNIQSVQAIYQGRRQPLGALYHTTNLPYIRQQLEKGERRLRMSTPENSIVFAHNIPERHFLNINSPQDIVDDA